jgi:hypothetical protein
MGRRQSTVGRRFGKITVLSRDPARGTQKHPVFNVRCDCGKEYLASHSTLQKAKGCKECSGNGDHRKYGDRKMEGYHLYNIWTGMRRRCNPRNINAHTERWAGRGIKVCPAWNDFVLFEKWSLSHGYALGLSLDRINNDGDYEPSNCEWVTRSENSKRARALYQFVPRKTDAFPYEALLHGGF